mmetsp:Transcript_22311/g.47516  ORF Transcript_22311/g.47516 Transcript_22311/m.47516 type:complete len:641 (-) Transcript_22311:111-2033(-)
MAGRWLPLPAVSCLALALSALWSAQPCAAECPSSPLVITVAGASLEIVIPALPNGGTYKRECDWIKSGYSGFIKVMCLGTKLTADTASCSPKDCEIGQSASTTVGTSNDTIVVTLSKRLAHRGTSSVPCSTLEPGYTGHVLLRCTLGDLIADSSSCTPAMSVASSLWRISNEDYLPGTWRIFETSFYTEEDCETGKLEGAVIAASEASVLGETRGRAFDSDFTTAWSAHCEQGCQPGTAWIGLAVPVASQRMRCVKMLQSQVACCGSKGVKLEVWDGSEWQSMQVWNNLDNTQMPDGKGFNLIVPKTCEKGRPDGVDIAHDCVGPPVVGVQAGQTCTAQCAAGYYGESAQFSCGNDGLFSGTTPICYELDTVYRIGTFTGVGLGLLFVAFQYKFWCMYKKVQLTQDLDMIPKDLMGRWTEKNGVTIWDFILAKHKEEAMKSAFDRGSAKPGKKDEKADKTVNEEDGSPRSPGGSPRKGKKKKKKQAGTDTEALEDEVEDLVAAVKGKVGAPQRGRYWLDGLCTPCQDPDTCLNCVFCPMCRIADTWHTLGSPSWMGYWTAYLMCVLCPFMWPCLGYYGRLRVRKAFGIALEPHRDFLIYFVCCCCCAPCAACQEARLVDAPVHFYQNKKKYEDMHKLGLA